MKHQEQVRLETDRVKMELETLNLERENVARAEAAERAAEEEAVRVQVAKAAADALKYENGLLGFWPIGRDFGRDFYNLLFLQVKAVLFWPSFLET